jgi:hypothetical protein
MRQVGDGARLNEQERLFLSLAEQLARPLLTVSHLSELASADGSASTEHWQTVHAITDSSLQLVESYALSLRVHGKVTPLAMEPVTISSLLYDTAERLAPLAKQYGVEIELDTGPRMQPVLADRTVLQSAFESLGQVFLASQAEAEDRAPVHLSAHRSRYGVVAGLYGEATTLGVDSLRRARSAQGTARQPVHQLVSGPAAGVFVADSLLQALATRLHVARYHSMAGLAATLHPSQQLQLVQDANIAR